MNHPYSGAASYIYANDFIASADRSPRENGTRVVGAHRNPVPGGFIHQDRKTYNYYHYSPEDQLKIDLRIKAGQTEKPPPTSFPRKFNLDRPLPPIPPSEGIRRRGNTIYPDLGGRLPSQRSSTHTNSHSNAHSDLNHGRLPSIPNTLPEAPRTKHRFRIHLNLSPFRFSFYKHSPRRPDHRDSWTSRNSSSGWRWSKSLSATNEGKNKTIVRRFRRWLSTSMRAPAHSGPGQSQSLLTFDEEQIRTSELGDTFQSLKEKERRRKARMRVDNGGENLITSVMSV